MYDFPISSGSPLFDMLTILLLEFLLAYLFGLIFPLLYSQCARFPHCAFPFFPNKCHSGFISCFFFRSISSDSKILRWSVPRILMPVQVIWRMELVVHHEESNWSSWKLYHLLTFLLMLDGEFKALPKIQAWATWWHYHYYCKSRWWSQC